MLTQKQTRNRQRHTFLLTFFEEPNVYEAKEVNGFTLVRQLNQNNGQWEVAIFPKEKWEKRLAWKQEQLLKT